MDLFPDDDLCRQLREIRPAARRTDPTTSHEAARGAGRMANTHRLIIIEAMKKHPNLTSAEIAHCTGLERHQAARRLPELRKLGVAVNGPARRCHVLGTMQMTWRLR